MILKRLKEIMDNRSVEIQHCNSVKIYTEEDSLYLDINGIPFSVEITYKGAVNLDSNLNLGFKVGYSRNKLTIINLFQKELPNKIFDFIGDMEILDCQVTNYNGETIKADITNNNRQTLIQVQKTNVEDDTLIIREEPDVFIERPLKTRKNPINLKGYKQEKLDTDQLLTIIPKLSEYRKRRVSEPVVRTTTTTPIKKIIKKTPTIKGGKY